MERSSPPSCLPASTPSKTKPCSPAWHSNEACPAPKAARSRRLLRCTAGRSKCGRFRSRRGAIVARVRLTMWPEERTDVAEHLFGEVWARGVLSIGDMRLLALSATTILGRRDLLQLRGALTNETIRQNTAARNGTSSTTTLASKTAPHSPVSPNAHRRRRRNASHPPGSATPLAYPGVARRQPCPGLALTRLCHCWRFTAPYTLLDPSPRTRMGLATYALREPLPVLTLALTRHVGCAVGIYRRLWPLQMTPVRTTNGATPGHRVHANDAVARQRNPVRSPTSMPRPRLPAEKRSDGAHPVRWRRCPTDTSPSHGGSDD